jgi:hypothetical protein
MGMNESRCEASPLNSFIPTNRLSSDDVLSLISTNLPSQNDCFICRHWRRTFLGLQHAEFGSLGPLDECTIYRSGIQPLFHSFLNIQVYIRVPVLFPQIKELTICHPVSPNRECTAAIVGLAKSHHALGRPLERMVFRAESMPEELEEELELWVGSAE